MKHKETKQILSILLAMIMLVGMLPTTALAEDKINQVSLTLDVPVIGQTLDFTPTAYEGIYEITSVRWLKDWGEHGNMLCDIYHTVEPGEPYTVRIYINPKEGYSFADLDDVTVTVNGSTDGVTFTHDDLYTGIICSVAFEKLGYAVSFNANGGTGTMDEVTDVYPDYTLPACDFTAPEGKVFNGWTVGSPSGKWYAEGSKLDVNSDVTLYAKWADPTGSHKITFVNRTTDPYSTVEIIVSEGMYTLPGIEGIFQIPWGSTFDDWGINTGSGYTYYDAGAEISVTEDLEIIATWAYIEYEYISKAIFDVKLNSGAEYKHGMLAGSLSVSLGDVTGSFKEGAAQPISLASGGYGHGYWIVSGDMLLGTDALSTRKDYRLYVKFDIPDDRNVRFNSDDFSLSGDLGNITARNIVSLDGALVAIFVLPAVPGTPLTANVVTFTLDGYAIDQTIPAVTVDSSTAHVSLQGSGYGIDNAYMIYEDYVDFDTKVTNLHAKFEKHQDYCLQIDYALDEGYSFPDSFWDGSYLKKDKFKLAGFEDAVVTAVTKTSVSFRLPQLGTTAVESLEITLNGYEAGKTAWDVSLTAPECMNLPELDNPTYPPYGRLYCYYDPVYGFGDSADGDCSPIDSGTVLKVGDQYPFAIKFYPVDGYNYSELEKENIRLVTPYGTCTATRFRPGFSENSYWLTFDLPAILTYTVSFDANGGTGTMEDVTGISGEYTFPENGFTAPDGKQFKAWSVDGNEKAVGDKITVTADTTVTAVWETIPAGHTCDIKSVAKVNPSCTEGGKEAYYKCEGCGKFYEDVLGTKEITDLASWGNIAKIAHTTKQTVTKATPTANGKIVNYCSVCKKTLSTIVIPKASSIKLKATSLTYNGKVRTPKVIVKDRTGKTLVKNTDYTVSYAKGRKYVGKYAVKITFKGKYSGTKTLYFTIKPKATSISSLKAGSKKFTVKWKKQATQTTGYQVQYSASSKFSKAKTVTVGKNTTVSKKISKLSGKKKYYVRVRTYKTVKINGKSIRIYSGWSKAKTVTTKK